MKTLKVTWRFGGGESEDLDRNKAITFTLSLSDCLDQTPALFVVVREKQNNLDFHSSYPSGWKYQLFRDCKTEFEYFEMLDIFHTVSNTPLLLQILWFVCLSSTNSMQCYSCCFNPEIELFVCLNLSFIDYQTKL